MRCASVISASVLSAHDRAADGSGVCVARTGLGDGMVKLGEGLPAGAEDGLPTDGDGTRKLAHPATRPTTRSMTRKRAGDELARPMVITTVRRSTGGGL
jgi:hypothetical protein